MTPRDWGQIVTTFCWAYAGPGDKAEKQEMLAPYKEQMAYLDSILPQLSTRGKKVKTEEGSERARYILAALCRTFSIAHQVNGDLVGRVNVVCHLQEQFVSFLETYCEFLGKPLGKYTASYLSQNERNSWAQGAAWYPALSEPFSVVEGGDSIFENKGAFLGFTGALSKNNAAKTGIVLLSEKPLDMLIPPSGCTWDMLVIDVEGILLEAVEERNKQSLNPLPGNAQKA